MHSNIALSNAMRFSLDNFQSNYIGTCTCCVLAGHKFDRSNYGIPIVIMTKVCNASSGKVNLITIVVIGLISFNL